MKKILIVFLSFCCVQACFGQFSVRDANKTLKGNPIQSEAKYYSDVEINPDGSLLLEEPIVGYKMTYEKGKVKKFWQTSGYLRVEKRESVYEYKKDGTPVKIKSIITKGSQTKTEESIDLTYKKGHLAGEKRYEDGVLVERFVYEAPDKDGVVRFIHFPEENKGMPKRLEGAYKNDEYGIVFHHEYEKSETFTTIAIDRTAVSDTEIHATIKYTVEDLSLEYESHEIMERDHYGNEVKRVTTLKYPKRPVERLCLITRYQYEGEPSLFDETNSPTAEPKFKSIQFSLDSGITVFENVGMNVMIDFNNEGNGEGTWIANDKRMFQKEQPVEVQKGWILKLKDVKSGTFRYDERLKSLIVWAKNGEYLVRAKASVDAAGLVKLTPTKFGYAPIIFTTRKPAKVANPATYEPAIIESTAKPNTADVEVEIDMEIVPPAPEEAPVFMTVDKEPSFPGGQAAMMQFISNRIKYPEIARENGITGNVVLEFIVEKDGTLTNQKIVRNIGGGCGHEALRVLYLMPKWEPGMNKGVPKRVKHFLPVRFLL